MSSITRATRKVLEMNKDVPNQDAEVQETVSDYAPRRAGEPYLTEAMPAGNINMGDPLRLTQMAGPAINQIGRSTSDQIELSALTLVENANRGAETLLAEAHAQATEMVRFAETKAAEMRTFAVSIREHATRQAAQVGSFCAIAESLMVSMCGFGDQFKSIVVANAAAEKLEQEHLIQIPEFLSRNGKN